MADALRAEGKGRVLSAFWMLILVVFCVLYDPWSFLLLLTLVLSLALFEWQRMTMGGFDPKRDSPAIVLLIAVLISAMIDEPMAWAILAGSAVLVGLWHRRPDRWFWAAGGMVYLALPALALLTLRGGSLDGGEGPIGGEWIVLWLIGIVAACDTGAYGAGKLFGGAKLAPKISPKKTWAGFYGGITAAVIIAGGLAYAAPMADPQRWLSVIFALIVALSAQLGDALESAIKRRFSCKDSSNLIPGHGGVLDRCDSFIIAAPVTVVLLRIFEALG